jgi:hypothetical protein
MSPIFNGLRGERSGPVTGVSFRGGNRIAITDAYFEHKSCAVNRHAYTLDSSDNLASALQQNMVFTQLSGIALFLRSQRDKGSAPAPNPSRHQPRTCQ